MYTTRVCVWFKIKIFPKTGSAAPPLLHIVLNSTYVSFRFLYFNAYIEKHTICKIHLYETCLKSITTIWRRQLYFCFHFIHSFLIKPFAHKDYESCIEKKRQQIYKITDSIPDLTLLKSGTLIGLRSKGLKRCVLFI